MKTGFGEKKNYTYGIRFVCTKQLCEQKIYDFWVYMPFKKLDNKKKAQRRRCIKNAPEKKQKSKDKKTKSGTEIRSGLMCKYYGRQQHHVKRTECPGFGKTCSKCGKKGHFSSVCLAGKKVNQFEDLETSSEHKAFPTLAPVSLVDTKARQWFTEIQFYKSPKDDFTTSMS